MTAQGLEEYRELKATLLREAALVGATSAVATLPFLGAEVSGAIAAGAVAGCAYLFLLGRETDTVGDSAEALARVGGHPGSVRVRPGSSHGPGGRAGGARGALAAGSARALRPVQQ